MTTRWIIAWAGMLLTPAVASAEPIEVPVPMPGTTSETPDELAAAPQEAPAPAPAPAPDPVVPFSALEDLATISEADLGNMRGGQAIVVGNQTLTAITRGNVLTGGYSAGQVNLSDNAFSNFNGVGNVAINTGAQVSLQSAMNLVININPN